MYCRIWIAVIRRGTCVNSHLRRASAVSGGGDRSGPGRPAAHRSARQGSPRTAAHVTITGTLLSCDGTHVRSHKSQAFSWFCACFLIRGSQCEETPAVSWLIRLELGAQCAPPNGAEGDRTAPHCSTQLSTFNRVQLTSLPALLCLPCCCCCCGQRDLGSSSYLPRLRKWADEKLSPKILSRVPDPTLHARAVAQPLCRRLSFAQTQPQSFQCAVWT